MTTLKFMTVDQHLVLQRQPVVASGDKNSVLIQIQLCSMWDGFDVKVAFYKDGNRDFVLDIPLEKGECMVPPEMLDSPCVLNIGVWGKDAKGRYKTSTMVKYRVQEGTPIEAGLTLIDVSNGTAIEDQVLEGATFFAGDTEMKAGNIKTYEDGDPAYMIPYVEADPTVPGWAKSPTPPTETDPTVPTWAKKPNPPTAAEVGAAPAVESSEHPGCYFRTANGVTEWVNPPAMLGIEYRTTERWNGKPVYVTAMDLGILPTSGDKDVYYPVSLECENIVSYDVIISNPDLGARSLPTFASDGSIMAYAWALNASIRITVMRDMSAYNGRAIVKYTKD